MIGLKNMRLSWKFGILITLVVAGYIVLGSLAYNTIESVRISSKTYNDVMQGKDLLADIMPPPLFIIEPYVTARRMSVETDAAELDKLVHRYKELETEYKNRFDHYRKTQIPNELADGVHKSDEFASTFFHQVDNQYLALLRKGDKAEIRKFLMENLQPTFEKHQQAIEQLVKATEKQVTADEQVAISLASSRITYLIIFGFSGIVLVGGLAVAISLGVTRPIREVASVMQAIEKGDLTKSVTYDGKDEIGYLATSANRVVEFTRVNAGHVAQLAALENSLAVIEFNMDGTVINANKNFLDVIGYTLDEIKGKNHGMFVEQAYRNSQEYNDFWARLNRGEYQSAEFKRIGKGGKEIYIQATYNPIKDLSGKPYKVVKYATDITQQSIKNSDMSGQVSAVRKFQGVIEFKLDGTILDANENFLQVLGYSLDEIKGRHHSMLIEETARNTVEYREFWARLNRGEYQSAEYKRIGKGGKEIWLQATYNPILDRDGKPTKVVKFANDITEQVKTRNEIAQFAARDKQQAEELRQKVETILTTVNGLAHGDFSQEIPDLGDDSIGQMAKALNLAITSVRSTLDDVRNVASTVSSAAQQLSSASEEIASGAQEQASSLEETAASLEEITATIKQNTDSAQQARQFAGSSKEVAEKGGQVVGSAVEAMTAINQSSKKIAEIITAIDEIAFQTNLLALNAAVEAARAGEQGRGFAVVAAEVRNLAQRSATAAKEIKSLIQDSVRKVDNGTELVNRSGQTLTEIVTSVKRVTDIVTEIAAASREQSTGVDQVNKAVAQMDKVTQTNASQTEELSSTSQILLSHADQLQTLVSRFKLGVEPVATMPTSTHAPTRGDAKSKKTARSKPRELVLNGQRNGNSKMHDLDLFDQDNTNGFKEF